MAAAFVALLCGAVGDDSAAFAVTTLAGQVAVSEASDGVGAGAMFRDPAGIAIQSELGRALIADYANFAVRSLQLATGNVTTLAGRLGSAGSEDGAAGVARFMGPAALAVHPSGSYALVVDQPTHAIRRLDLATLAVTTVAGQAGAAGADDGSGLAAKFRLPGGIAIPQNVLQAGFALVADTGNGVVRRLQLGDDAKVVDGALVSWRVTTFAGTAGSAAGAAEADGVGTAAAFREPRGIAVADGGGFAFVTGGGVTGGGDGAAASMSNRSMSNRVRRLDLKTGAVTTVAGPPVGEDGSGGGGPTGATGFGSGGSTAGAVDGVGDAARFDDPVAVALNSWMYALVADAGNREVRMVNQATRMVTTVAGLHSALAAAAADGVGAAARFGDRLGAVAIDPIGGFALLVDGHAIRRLVLPCNLGRRWSPTGTLNCSVCAAGSFTSGGTGVTRTACTICPAGSACNGGSALTTCTAGRFAPAGSAACSAACGQDDRYAPRGAAECAACPSGSFTAGGDASTRESCAACPEGHKCDGSSVRVPCAKGRFAAGAGNAACALCPLHQYQPSAGGAACQLCSELEGGALSVTAAKGSTSAADCTAAGADRARCPPGASAVHNNASSAACLPCEAGRFQPAANSTDACERCDCGTFSRVGAAACDAVCLAGTYGDSDSGTCEPCPAEHFCLSSQKRPFHTARQCIPGQRELRPPSASSDRACEPCGAMHFSRAVNAASCEVCPGGKFQAEPGQPFCEAKQPCPPGTYETDEADAAGVATYSSARCRPCPPMHYSAQSNLRSCSRCPAGKFQASAGEPFCETCGEGVTCNVQAGSGLVELRACPVGNECRSSGNGTAVEPCENKVSDAATGKCVSCDDREFAHTSSNECVACPRLRPEDDKSAELARGVQCVGGGISVQDDFFVVGSRLRAVALGRGTTVVRCRGSGVCRTPAPTRAGNFTVRTACVPPAAGALCGACAPTHAKTAQTCVACSGNSLFSGCILAAAVTLFGVLYRQCIKFAMNNACRGHTSRFMTSSMLKIAMTFLFNTSLLSRFQLDWSGLLRTSFEVSAVAGSGDPTIFGVQCFGLGLHEKTVLVAAAPFVVPLLPLPMLARAWIKGGGPGGGIGTVFKVPARDAYWAAVLIGWWLVHPAVLAHCIVALMTLSVGGREYALADLSIEATDPAYRQTRLLATVVLCTFVPAVPAYVFGRLWKFRRSLRAGELSSGAQDAIPESQRKRLFYFFGSYAPERYYWESVVFATRTVMVGLAAISSTLVDEGQVQVVIFVTTWVALVHFMLVFKFEPYSRKMESQVNKLTWFTLLSLLLSALGLSTGAAAATDGVFKTVLLRLCATLLLATVAVLVWVFAGQCHGKREQIREQKRTKRQQLCEEEPSGKDTSIEWLDVEHTPAAEPARGRDEWNIFPSKGSQLTVMHNPLSSSLGGGGSMSPATSRMHISARLDH